jgi:hypothetical protein
MPRDNTRHSRSGNACETSCDCISACPPLASDAGMKQDMVNVQSRGRTFDGAGKGHETNGTVALKGRA